MTSRDQPAARGRFLTRLVCGSLFLTSGCVIGRSTRASSSESAEGPSVATVAGSPISPSVAPAVGEIPPQRGKPGAVWVRGYWHWDGVRYAWQRGHWEPEPAAAK